MRLDGVTVVVMLEELEHLGNNLGFTNELQWKCLRIDGNKQCGDGEYRTNNPTETTTPVCAKITYRIPTNSYVLSIPKLGVGGFNQKSNPYTSDYKYRPRTTECQTSKYLYINSNESSNNVCTDLTLNQNLKL